VCGSGSCGGPQFATLTPTGYPPSTALACSGRSWRSQDEIGLEFPAEWVPTEMYWSCKNLGKGFVQQRAEDIDVRENVRRG